MIHCFLSFQLETESSLTGYEFEVVRLRLVTVINNGNLSPKHKFMSLMFSVAFLAKVKSHKKL